MYVAEERLLALQNSVEKARTDLKSKLTRKGISFNTNDTLRKLISLIPRKISRPSNLMSVSASQTSVPLDDGNVLITGGENYTVNRYNQNMIYNIDSQTFNTKQYYGVTNHTAVKIDHNILISGGRSDVGGNDYHYLKTQKVYNTNNNTYCNKADLPKYSADHTASILNNNTIIISGGHWSSSSNSESIKNQYAYNFTNNTFTSKVDLPQISYESATITHDNNILFFGGSSGHFKYNYTNNTVITISNWLIGLIGITAVKIDNESVIISGGTYGTGNDNFKQHKYRISNNTSSQIVNYPISIYNHSAAKIKQTAILYTGGQKATGNILVNNQYIYDSNNNKFI